MFNICACAIDSPTCLNLRRMSSTSVALRSLRDSVWLDQARYEQAECRYQQALASRYTGIPTSSEDRAISTGYGLSDSIEATMSIIQQSLSATTQTNRRADQEQRISALEKENQQLKKDLAGLLERVVAIEARLGSRITNGAAEDEDEEDFDLFGSDEEEDAVESQTKKVVQHSQQKKPGKPAVVAKSTIVLEVKPWDTETDMKEVEKLVRDIAKDGLLWGASKLVPVAYGIMKLQISCVIEDEKVGTDFLEESITAFEDHVQSVDVVAFNKI